MSEQIVLAFYDGIDLFTYSIVKMRTYFKTEQNYMSNTKAAIQNILSKGARFTVLAMRHWQIENLIYSSPIV